MTREEFLTDVYNKLSAQGAPGKHDGVCWLRTPTGLKCAMGMYIKDGDYYPDLEVYTVFHPELFKLLPPEVQALDCSFLNKVQNAHDRASSKPDFIPALKAELEKVRL